MNKRPLAYIIIGIITIIIVGGVMLLRSYMPKHIWTENLVKKNKEPYGTSILFDIVKNTCKKKNFYELTNTNFAKAFNENKGFSYFYIGTNYFIDTVDVFHIIEYVEKGNTAFVSSTNHLNKFIRIWLDETDDANFLNENFSKVITASIKDNKTSINKDFQFHYQVLKDTMKYSWSYFNETFFDAFVDFDITTHSEIDSNRTDFVSIKLDKGTLYLHANPILLSNYHLANKDNLPYLQTFWNILGMKSIIWDSSSSTVYNKPSFSHLQESPLRFILKHKSFRWAWFVLLGVIIWFIIFQSKRVQNTIPILAKKENNTLDYAKAVSALYYQSKSHKAITNEMLSQLYSFIKARYKIKLGKEKLKSVNRLAKVSGIGEDKLEELFKLEIKLLYDKYAESEQLYKLYNLVDYFYKNCN